MIVSPRPAKVIQERGLGLGPGEENPLQSGISYVRAIYSSGNYVVEDYARAFGIGIESARGPVSLGQKSVVRGSSGSSCLSGYGVL